MQSEDSKIVAVLGAYKQVLLSTGRTKYVTGIIVPNRGSKHYAACVQMFDSAMEFGTTVVALMKICLDNFSPYWCQQSFKKTYPPAPVVTAESSRNRALKNFPMTLKSKRPDELAQFYANQLAGLPEAVVVGLLANGFLPTPEMDGLVMEILEKEWAKI